MTTPRLCEKRLPPDQAMSPPTELESSLCSLLDVLTPTLRHRLSRKDLWHESPGMLVAATFISPGRIEVDTQRLKTPGAGETGTLFHAMASYLVQELDGLDEFSKTTFEDGFTAVALHRYRQDPGFVPPDVNPNPTQIFLHKLWSTGTDHLDLAQLWLESVRAARSRDPYKILRYGGYALLQQQPVQRLMKVANETVRLLRQHRWEVGFSLQSEADPTSTSGQTSLRAGGVWRQFALGPAEPMINAELRITQPLANSDLLWLAGWRVQSEQDSWNFRFEVEAGYSSRRLATHPSGYPGVEWYFGLHKSLADHTFLELLLGMRYALDPTFDDPGPFWGLFFKWAPES